MTDSLLCFAWNWDAPEIQKVQKEEVMSKNKRMKNIQITMKEIFLTRVQCTYATFINICAYRGLCQGVLLLASFRLHHYSFFLTSMILLLCSAVSQTQ